MEARAARAAPWCWHWAGPCSTGSALGGQLRPALAPCDCYGLNSVWAYWGLAWLRTRWMPGASCQLASAWPDRPAARLRIQRGEVQSRPVSRCRYYRIWCGPRSRSRIRGLNLADLVRSAWRAAGAGAGRANLQSVQSGSSLAVCKGGTAVASMFKSEYKCSDYCVLAKNNIAEKRSRLYQMPASIHKKNCFGNAMMMHWLAAVESGDLAGLLLSFPDFCIAQSGAGNGLWRTYRRDLLLGMGRLVIVLEEAGGDLWLFRPGLGSGPLVRHVSGWK
ncbi:hypothetical protein FQR65_LT20607 [Abscondita terminalis]|nr:hypothetical protein FQR65_LT20607 [Abscondita terminalis]